MFKSQVEPASGFTAKFWTFYGVIIWSKGKVRMELALVSVKKAHVLYLTSFLLSLLLWVMAYGQSANGNLDSYCKNQTKQKRQWKAIRKSMAGGGGGGGGGWGGGSPKQRLCSSRKYPYSPNRRLFCLPPLSPPGNSSFASYFASKILASKIPLPLGISDDLPWGGYAFFQELHIIQLAPGRSWA